MEWPNSTRAMSSSSWFAIVGDRTGELGPEKAGACWGEGFAEARARLAGRVAAGVEGFGEPFAEDTRGEDSGERFVEEPRAEASGEGFVEEPRAEEFGERRAVVLGVAFLIVMRR